MLSRPQELWSLLQILNAQNQCSVNREIKHMLNATTDDTPFLFSVISTSFFNETDHATTSDISALLICTMNQWIGKITILPWVFISMNPEWVWWFLSIWNLVIISNSGSSQGSESRVEKTLEALSNILNQENSWLCSLLTRRDSSSCFPKVTWQLEGVHEHLFLLSIQSACFARAKYLRFLLLVVILHPLCPSQRNTYPRKHREETGLQLVVGYKRRFVRLASIATLLRDFSHCVRVWDLQ